MYLFFCADARMAELVDARDLKSLTRNGRASSSLALGTTIFLKNESGSLPFFHFRLHFLIFPFSRYFPVLLNVE